MTTVADALARARALGVDRLDGQLILARLLGCERSWLLAHDDARVAPEVAADVEAWLQRRADGEPLAYLLGEKEFHGLTLAVGPDVLIPRPDTETLVAWALESSVCATASAQVIDLGTGSGAIALALKSQRPGWRLIATDASDAALAVARRNASRLALTLDFRRGDWWQAVEPEDRFDLAVSNPPYIAADDPHLSALRHEPLVALASGDDGLGALRLLISAAPQFLNPDAWLLLEHGFEQSGSVQRLLTARGFVEIATRRDLAGHIRCTGARWPRATLLD